MIKLKDLLYEKKLTMGDIKVGDAYLKKTRQGKHVSMVYEKKYNGGVITVEYDFKPWRTAGCTTSCECTRNNRCKLDLVTSATGRWIVRSGMPNRSPSTTHPCLRRREAVARLAVAAILSRDGYVKKKLYRKKFGVFGRTIEI